jgi:AraC-like DNA-binding protein
MHLTGESPDDRIAPSIPLPEGDHFRGDRLDIFKEPGFPLGVFRVRNHIDLGLHTHDFFELVIILDGTAVHLTCEANYPLAAGDCFVIQPGVAHGYGQSCQLELCNILFDPGRLPLPREELSPLPGYHALFELEPSFRKTHRFQSRLFLPPDLRRQVMEWAFQLEEELKIKQDGYRFLGLALLVRMIGFLSRAYTSMTAPASRTLVAVNRVVSHMERHYANPMRLSDLARMAHMCERSLQRYFLQAFGMTPIDYLNRLRIDKACHLLGKHDLTVSQVADAVGIPNSNYFARLFHRLTDISPTAYRLSTTRLRQPIHLLGVPEEMKR